jgi:hypothetical protein
MIDEYCPHLIEFGVGGLLAEFKKNPPENLPPKQID